MNWPIVVDHCLSILGVINAGRFVHLGEVEGASDGFIVRLGFVICSGVFGGGYQVANVFVPVL